MIRVNIGEHAVTFVDRTTQLDENGDPVSTLGPQGHAEIFLQACAANGIEATGVFDDTSTTGLRNLPTPI
jgi:hypothetical protein